jgi:hypothetical protein
MHEGILLDDLGPTNPLAEREGHTAAVADEVNDAEAEAGHPAKQERRRGVLGRVDDDLTCDRRCEDLHIGEVASVPSRFGRIMKM